MKCLPFPSPPLPWELFPVPVDPRMMVTGVMEAADEPRSEPQPNPPSSAPSAGEWAPCQRRRGGEAAAA